MVEWIMNPLHYSAETAMPDLDVSDQDARDISAYLIESHRKALQRQYGISIMELYE
jgi:cytochrome c1